MDIGYNNHVNKKLETYSTTSIYQTVKCLQPECNPGNRFGYKMLQ